MLKVMIFSNFGCILYRDVAELWKRIEELSVALSMISSLSTSGPLSPRSPLSARSQPEGQLEHASGGLDCVTYWALKESH